MGQILHKRATTTYAIRAAIQRSEATVSELAARYNINPKTVMKWKHRDDVAFAKAVERANPDQKKFCEKIRTNAFAYVVNNLTYSKGMLEYVKGMQ